MFVDLFKVNNGTNELMRERLVKTIMSPKIEKFDEKDEIAPLLERNAEQAAHILHLETELKSLRESLLLNEPCGGELELLKLTISSQQKSLLEQKERYIILEGEQEDLLLCMAEQEEQVEELKKCLNALGVDV